MRSDSPLTVRAQKKTVLVLGDSVVNGGALLDQNEIATQILQRSLKDTWVGNISAGSWGPANLLEYTRRFGWFNSDLSVLVLSTHDLTDLPEFRASYGDDFPTKTPNFALQEALSRYGPRYIPYLRFLATPISPPTRIYSTIALEQEGRLALRTLLYEMRVKSKYYFVLLHPTVNELNSPEPPAKRVMIQEISGIGINHLDLSRVRRWGKHLYRDDIHLNSRGQAVLADILLCLWTQKDPACVD